MTPLWQTIRDRLERNGLTVTGVVTLDLDYQAAEDLSGLLKRAVPPGRARLRLAELDAALRSSAVAQGLVTVTAELTGGSLTDRKAVSEARRTSRYNLWEYWENSLANAGLAAAPWVVEWQHGIRRAGLLGRAGEAAETVIQQTMAVLRTMSETTPLADRSHDAMRVALPLPPSFELAELASRACGDAHALDDGRLVTVLVLRAIAVASGEPLPSTAARRRDLWAMAGINPDTVSGTVLTWGLRPPRADPWAMMMHTRADLGLATHITLQEWHAGANQPWAATGDRLFVCENPQVLQAAARAGVSHPMLCTSGNPATVATLALTSLVQAGVKVFYHGDFDIAGVTIAARLFSQGAHPWRFSGDDYLAAVRSTGSSLPITGTVPDTPWSPFLAHAMRSHQIAVHEESLLETLLSDLSDQ
ncbi:TIGR02679 family protein [Actinocrispum wychmicini]|uniref:TIGR02679 family protein n=1 Tax=Actinocrispum wychmicini TaxID=1213861 RepID=UPI001404489E|nr:TIGR02679 family protein [Actinocrispum wychmicini]